MNQNIGYVICESAVTAKESTIVDQKSGRVTIETILQDMNVKNRNSRFYAGNEMQPALKAARLTELIESGNLLGEAGHPISKDLSRQQVIYLPNTSHKILKVWTEGNDIKAYVKGTPNQRGDEFNNFILDGTKPSFSLRAIGTVKNTGRGAEVQNITIITWDWVIYPSHKRAYMQNICNESSMILPEQNQFVVQENDKGLLIPITNEKIINTIKNESANVNSILESYQTIYDQITLIENGTKVQMSDRMGHMFIINLENYVQDKIMDYCCR